MAYEKLLIVGNHPIGIIPTAWVSVHPLYHIVKIVRFKTIAIHVTLLQ